MQGSSWEFLILSILTNCLLLIRDQVGSTTIQVYYIAIMGLGPGRATLRAKKVGRSLQTSRRSELDIISGGAQSRPPLQIGFAGWREGRGGLSAVAFGAGRSTWKLDLRRPVASLFC